MPFSDIRSVGVEGARVPQCRREYDKNTPSVEALSRCSGAAEAGSMRRTSALKTLQALSLWRRNFSTEMIASATSIQVLVETQIARITRWSCSVFDSRTGWLVGVQRLGEEAAPAPVATVPAGSTNAPARFSQADRLPHLRPAAAASAGRDCRRASRGAAAGAPNGCRIARFGGGTGGLPRRDRCRGCVGGVLLPGGRCCAKRPAPSSRFPARVAGFPSGSGANGHFRKEISGRAHSSVGRAADS